MSDVKAVNLTSLNLVSEELRVTIEQSVNDLEIFASDRESAKNLQQCIEGIKQIAGTFNLIQLRGPDLLAQEMIALANEFPVGADSSADAALSALSSAFFLLPRYLEYTQQTKRNTPILLLDLINELRSARKEAPLPESHFFTADLNIQRPANSTRQTQLGEDLQALVRRLRHMYQAGFVSLLQGKQTRPSLAMMRRAIQRIDAVTGSQKLGKLWWLTNAALTGMISKTMEITILRKRLFGAVDRQIKKLQNEGQKAFDQDPPAVLLKELLFLIALSGSAEKEVIEVLTACKVPPLSYTDAELQREKDALGGPSMQTVSSVAAVLRDEIRKTKEFLERASQAGDSVREEFGELVETLTKVADILSVVGLNQPSKSLKEDIRKVESWRDDVNFDGSELIELADTLLYVESAVAGMDRLNLSSDALNQANSLARMEIVASNQLAEAEVVVIREAEAGLSLVKRALNSYAESNYDRVHINNVAASLNTVRGGMILLNLQRAAKVVNSCCRFVENTLLKSDQPAALQPMLETFADAVIGLEYYLDAVTSDKSADDSVLQIAEESLEALGYSVNA